MAPEGLQRALPRTDDHVMRLHIAAIAVLIAACGDAGATTVAPPSDTATTATGDTTTATTSPATTVTSAQSQPATTIGLEEAAAAFLAAVDAELAATKYAGQAIEAPDVFLATGWLFCEQLDEGLTVDGVLTGYVEELSGGSIDDAGDDDLALAGSIFGAALGMLCPQHAGALEG